MTAPTLDRPRVGGRRPRARYTPPPAQWADSYLADDRDVDWVQVRRALGGDVAAQSALNTDEFAEAVWWAILRLRLTPSAAAHLLHCNLRTVRRVIEPTAERAA